MFAPGKHSVCSRVCFKRFRLFRTKLVERLTMFQTHCGARFEHITHSLRSFRTHFCVRNERTTAFAKNAVRSAVNAGERTKLWTRTQANARAFFLLFLIARTRTRSYCVYTDFRMDSHISLNARVILKDVLFCHNLQPSYKYLLWSENNFIIALIKYP